MANFDSFDTLREYVTSDGDVMIKTLEVLDRPAPDSEKVAELRRFLELPPEYILTTIIGLNEVGFKVELHDQLPVKVEKRKWWFSLKKTTTTTTNIKSFSVKFGKG